ncbi:MAG: hydrogenase maturation protease [Candidatus Methanofastidiosia archaeon]
MTPKKYDANRLQKNTLAVIAIGNDLMGDDGAGPAVFAALQTETLPVGIDFIDGGTGGMALLHVIKAYKAVIFIDCVDFGGVPGEVRVFAPEEVTSSKTSRYSLHELDLLEVIHLSRKIGEVPETITIVAIQPERIGPGLPLSRAVSVAIPWAVKEALSQIMKMKHS